LSHNYNPFYSGYLETCGPTHYVHRLASNHTTNLNLQIS
jgi:hypothetical protein